MPIRPANYKTNNGGGWGPPVLVGVAAYTLLQAKVLVAPDSEQASAEYDDEIIIPEVSDAAWLGFDMDIVAARDDNDNVSWFRTETLRQLTAVAPNAIVDSSIVSGRNALVFPQASQYYRHIYIGRTANFRLLFSADNAAEDANPVRLWKIP